MLSSYRKQELLCQVYNKAVRFWSFREPDIRNWQSLRIRVIIIIIIIIIQKICSAHIQMYMYIHLAGCSRRKSTNTGASPISFTISVLGSFPCLLSGGTETCSLGLRETPACIRVIPCLSQPRMAC